VTESRRPGDRSTYGDAIGELAHRAADQDPSREYCVEDYRSGTLVPAAELRLQCWGAPGESLGSFAEVDKLALELPAGRNEIAFDLCVTGIRVGE
jgi:hypothetical protein